MASCRTVPVTGRSQFNLLTHEEDEAIGAQSYAELLADAQFVTSGLQYDQVQRVVGHLVEVADDPSGFDWEVKLVRDDSVVNAWCLPGGKMAVYTGILPFTVDDTGLAVVMGHEIGHAVAGHGTERMTHALGIQIALDLAQGVGLAWNQYGDVALDLLIFKSWGRKQELEADHIGLIYMARAGYDPSLAVDFWKRMAAGKGGAPPEILSTHPSDQTRIERIEELLPNALEVFRNSTP
jgi:predicted Zn-dependent protease